MYALIWFVPVFLVCGGVALPQNEAEILGPDLASHYRHLQAQLRNINNSPARKVSAMPLSDGVHSMAPAAPKITTSATRETVRNSPVPPVRPVAELTKAHASQAVASGTSNGRWKSSAVPSTKEQDQAATGQSKVSESKKGEEDVWPHKDDPVKAAAVAEASIAAELAEASTDKRKPRMLNAPKIKTGTKDRSSEVTGTRGNAAPKPVHQLSHSPAPAASKTGLPEDRAKWESFRAKVKGSKHLKNGEFLHGGVSIRGLSAVSGMKTGTEVLRVPAELVLSKANPAVQNFYHGIDFEEPSDPTWKLVSFLAASKRLGDRSPWGPYLAHLPKLDDFKAFHPLWASEDLLHLFAPIPLLHDVREYRRRARTEWRQWQDFSQVLEQKLADGLKSDEQTEALRKAALDINEKDIQWAFTVVLTRGFGTPQGSALAPVADDLNTDGPFKLNVQWHGQQDGSVQLVTTASVAKGDELLTSYSAGPRNNDDFAASFGFALKDNADVVGKLSPRACDSMAAGVKSRSGSKGSVHSEKCAPPQAEQQPAVFCTLLALAKEHCTGTDFD